MRSFAAASGTGDVGKNVFTIYASYDFLLNGESIMRDTSKEMTVQEAVHELAQHGYRECTEEANKQNVDGKPLPYAFEGPSGDGVYYYCDSEEDVFALLKLMWFFVDQGQNGTLDNAVRIL